jgi:hypothetical protein
VNDARLSAEFAIPPLNPYGIGADLHFREHGQRGLSCWRCCCADSCCFVLATSGIACQRVRSRSVVRRHIEQCGNLWPEP